MKGRHEGFSIGLTGVVLDLHFSFSSSGDRVLRILLQIIPPFLFVYSLSYHCLVRGIDTVVYSLLLYTRIQSVGQSALGCVA